MEDNQGTSLARFQCTWWMWFLQICKKTFKQVQFIILVKADTENTHTHTHNFLIIEWRDESRCGWHHALSMSQISQWCCSHCQITHSSTKDGICNDFSLPQSETISSHPSNTLIVCVCVRAWLFCTTISSYKSWLNIVKKYIALELPT